MFRILAVLQRSVLFKMVYSKSCCQGNVLQNLGRSLTARKPRCNEKVARLSRQIFETSLRFSSFNRVISGTPVPRVWAQTYLFPVGVIAPHVVWDLIKLEFSPSSSTRTAVMVDWARTKVPSTLAGVRNVPDCNWEVLTNFRFMGERMLGFKVPWSQESLSLASDISWEPSSVLASGQSSATMVSSWESEEGL